MGNNNLLTIVSYVAVVVVTAIIAITIKGYYISVSLYPHNYLDSYVTATSGVFGLLGIIILISALFVLVPCCFFLVRYLKNLTDLHRYQKLHELELNKEIHINTISRVRNEKLCTPYQLTSIAVLQHETSVSPDDYCVEECDTDVNPDDYCVEEHDTVLDCGNNDDDEEDVIYESINSNQNPYVGVISINKKDDNGYLTGLLEELIDSKRILIIGSQGSGKTTLFQHLIKQKLGQGHLVVVMDSHTTPGKWDERVRVVGQGRNYPAIAEELENSLHLMDHRYEQLGSGAVIEGEFPQVYYFSDEWTTVSKNIQNLSDFLLPLLTEGRKVGINFILSCHSKTASSIGIKGSYDLISNFEYILTLKNNKGVRFAEVTTSANPKDKVLYSHPGEFI